MFEIKKHRLFVIFAPVLFLWAANSYSQPSLADLIEKQKNDDLKCKVLDVDIADEYSGGCKNGLASGEGKAKGRDQYTGWFLNGKKHGKGKYTWPSSGYYEGDWRNDTMEGKGTKVWGDGNRYEGEWRNGEIDGKGTRMYSGGGQYIGEFWNGKRHGFGTLSFVRGHKSIASWEKDGDGKWVGDKYVVQGKFSEDNIRLSCSSPADCDSIDRRNALQAEQYNRDRCKSLYAGKPVTLSYDFMGRTYADAVIVGIGAGVASAKVIGGSAYVSEGYGIGTVHERACSAF